MIRLFEPGDEDAVATIVGRCVREINSRDYPPEIVTRMCAHFTPARILALASDRQMFVFIADGSVAGTVSRDGNKVYTMFVQPGRIGQGIGRALIDHIENLAAADGFTFMETGASLTAHGFYQRRGYADVRMSETEFGLNHIMRKPL